MERWLWLFAAGGCGSLARYGLGGLVQRHVSTEFPMGTLIVNLIGCLIFGFVWSLADERLVISGETRILILTGFVGAFTTFSTFAFETSQMLRASAWWFAAMNVGVHQIVGVLAVVAGIKLGQLI
jgi:CrcB protein